MKGLFTIGACLAGAFVGVDATEDYYTVKFGKVCTERDYCNIDDVKFDKLEESLTFLRHDPECDVCTLSVTGSITLTPTICKDKEGNGGVLGLTVGHRVLPMALGNVYGWDAVVDSACIDQLKQATLFLGDEDPCTAQGNTVDVTFSSDARGKIVRLGSEFLGGASFVLTDVSKCSGLVGHKLTDDLRKSYSLHTLPPDETNLGWASWFSYYYPPYAPEGTRELVEDNETAGEFWGPAARCNLGGKVTGITVYYVPEPVDYYTRSIQLICDDDEMIFSAEEKQLWTNAAHYACPQGTAVSGIETTNDTAGTRAIKDVTVHCAGTGSPMPGGEASEEGLVYTTATFRGEQGREGFKVLEKPAEPTTACNANEDIVGFATSMTYDQYTQVTSGLFALRSYCAERVPKYC